MIVTVIQIEKIAGIVGAVPRDGRQVVEVAEILLPYRQVEAELVTDGFLRVLVVVLSHDLAHGIGGKHREEKKHQRNHSEKE